MSLSLAQRIGRPPDGWEVIVSIPVGEEKSSVVSMKLVFPLTALTVFLLLSYLTYPAKREGKICSRF